MDETPIVSSAEGHPAQFTLEEIASLTGMAPQIIVKYTEAQYVRAVEVDATGTPRFDETAIFRLRHIEELQLEHGVNERSLPYVLRLFDRLRSAERELRKLRERLR